MAEVEIIRLDEDEKCENEEIRRITRFFELKGVEVEIKYGDLRREIKRSVEERKGEVMIYGKREAANGQITIRRVGEREAETISIEEMMKRYEEELEKFNEILINKKEKI